MNSIWQEMNTDVADCVKALGYDPSGLVSTDEYIVMMTKVRRVLEGTPAQEEAQSPEVEKGNLYRYVVGEDNSLSLEEKGRRLRHIIEYQDELLFIQNGTDISYYPIWYRLPAHYHRNAYFDIAYVFDGKARYYFPGLSVVDLAPGDFLIIPPESEHGECAVLEGTRAITCSIRKNAFLRIFFSVFDDNPLLQTFFRRMLSSGSGGDNAAETPSPIPYLLFSTRMSDGGADAQLQELFCRLMAEHDRKEPYYNKMLDSLMGQIFVRLLRCHEKQMVLPPSVRLTWKPDYEEILRFIEKNATRQLTLEELSAQFHYSRRQLIRIIRACTGRSFSDLIRERRMELARDLLSGTSLPVEEIANRCGYENFSSFSRAFSATVNVTPGEYRHAKQP